MRISCKQKRETLGVRLGTREARTDDNDYFVSELILSQERAGTKPHSNFTRDRNSSLFGIAYRLSESEVEMLEEASSQQKSLSSFATASFYFANGNKK